MSKFKVGDKVKVTHKISSSARELNGKICTINTIETIDRSTVYATLKEEPSFNCKKAGVWLDEIELVTNSLEELVKKANDGYEALEELSKYKDQIEFTSFSGPNNLYGSMVHICKYKLRIKQKSFEPFKVGQKWEVSLQGDRIEIGCKSFNCQQLLDTLDCVNNPNKTNTYYDMRGCRTGIKYAGHEISWEDSDKIIEALNKAGYK